MTVKRVQAAAAARGMFFNGVKSWQNSVVGYGYFMFAAGGGFIQADTLTGLYNAVMKYPKVKDC